MGRSSSQGSTLVLACCLLTVASSAGAKINRERCDSHGFGETLTCGTCDRMRDALGEDGGAEAEVLVKQCTDCCKNGLVSYIQGKFEVCD